MSSSSPTSQESASGGLQAMSARHLSSLQHLRDETVILFSALEQLPEAQIEKILSSCQPFIKNHEIDCGSSLEDAKLGMTLIALRRLLRLNEIFFQRLYSKSQAQPEGASFQDDSANASPETGKNNSVFESFQKDLRAAGANELPAVSIASLLMCERLLAEQVHGRTATNDSRPDVMNLILVEVKKSAEGDPSIIAEPWKITLRKRQSLPIESRILQAFFTTAFVAALEAVKIASKKF